MGNGINPTKLPGMTSCIAGTLTLQELKEQGAPGWGWVGEDPEEGLSFLHLLAKAPEVLTTLLMSAKRRGWMLRARRGAPDHAHSAALAAPGSPVGVPGGQRSSPPSYSFPTSKSASACVQEASGGQISPQARREERRLVCRPQQRCKHLRGYA